MRDFEWERPLWVVIKEDGTYAGVPCLSEEEARELSAQHYKSAIFAIDIKSILFSDWR